MKSAKLVAARHIEIVEEAPLTQPNLGMAIVRVQVVGICGTDMHIFEGERKDVSLPRVMGHELSGVVESVGGGVTNIAPGDRVTFDPVMACRTCAVCQKGHPNVCPQVRCYGVQMDGAFREQIEVPAAQLYRIPDGVSLEEAALIEPFSIASNILDRAGAKAGETIAIVGAGTIGLCLVQAAKGIGARVLAADVVDGKLARARDFGCDVTVNTANESLGEALARFAPDGVDIIVDAVGITPLLEACAALLTPTARLVVISFDGRPLPLLPVDITKKELTIVGSRMNALRFPEVISWLETGTIAPAKMISRVYPFAQIQQAFEAAVADKALMKVLVRLDGAQSAGE